MQVEVRVGGYEVINRRSDLGLFFWLSYCTCGWNYYVNYSNKCMQDIGVRIALFPALQIDTRSPAELNAW